MSHHMETVPDFTDKEVLVTESDAHKENFETKLEKYLAMHSERPKMIEKLLEQRSDIDRKLAALGFTRKRSKKEESTANPEPAAPKVSKKK